MGSLVIEKFERLAHVKKKDIQKLDKYNDNSNSTNAVAMQSMRRPRKVIR